ncbi:MAG: IS1380 family transposase, partial [Candidatus Muiribacteriota bacterium]
MNKKHINKSKARKSPKKVKIINSGKNLTSWAGLIPVIKFLVNQNFLKMIPEHITHERGCNAKYD